MSLEDREYQNRAEAEIAAAWRRGKRRILLVVPTGGGKTVIFVRVLRHTLARGRRALVLAHRIELISQAWVRLVRAGVSPEQIGVILSGVPESSLYLGGFNLHLPDAELWRTYARRRPRAPIQVASVQTLAAEGVTPDGISVCVADEAHHCTAPTWRAIDKALPELELLLGPTATPERADREPLGDVFDEMIQVIDVAGLTELGYLVPCDVIAPDGPRKEMAQHPRDAMRLHAPDGRAIWFCQGKDHARQLAAELTAAGWPAASVLGDTDKDARTEAIEGLRSGRYRALTNVFALTEGTDIPVVDTVGIARGVASWGPWMQSIGRGLRTHPASGKTRCTVLDPLGHVYKWGLPTDGRGFSLVSKASSAKPHSIPLRQCRGCGAVYRSAERCTRCGFSAPPLATPRVKQAEMKRVDRVASVGEKRAVYAKFAAEAKAKGHDHRAAALKFKGVYGHWPNFGGG